MSAVRSPVRSPIRSPVRDALRTEGFSPASLFSPGAQGAWYDPSDYSTLFQDSAGTTPVTAVEQPVRLMLDRSQGLVLGGNIAPAASALTASSIDNVGGASSTFSAGVFSITVGSSNASYPRARISVPGLTVGKTYRVRGTSAITGTIAGVLIRLATGGTANNVAAAATTSFDGIAVCAVTDVIEISPTGTGATGTITISSLTVEELPGNHATAPNDASRPVLRARYNLLTFSEQFDNAGWTNASPDLPTVVTNTSETTDPIGTNTAAKLTAATGGTSSQRRQLLTPPAGTTTYTATIYVKAGTSARTRVTLFRETFVTIASAFLNWTGTVLSSLSSTTGTTSFADVGNGWYRVTLVSGSVTPTSLYFSVYPDNSAGTGSIYAWGADLKTAADQTSTGGAYQRIAAATVYDTSNPVFRPYLAFDGSDDSLSTSAIDFSGTDEMTVFAGVTKLSDAATGLLAELSANVASNNGSFYLAAPGSNGATDIVFIPKGTTAASVTATGIAAPSTSVVTGLSDISTPVSTIRINGAQSAQNTSTQGTGNFGNHPLFIGARNNASFRFNGRLYSLAVLGRTATAPELSAMEAWVNGKTGGY